MSARDVTTAGPRVRGLVRVLLLGVLAIGLGSLGQGGWILVKARLAQVLLDRAFALERETGLPQKPWPWADSHPVAKIEVPRLGVSEVVLDGGSGQALAFGPGHLSGSGEIGARDTAVLAAHRDTHFRFLGAVVRGEPITVTRTDGRQFEYRVTGTRVLAWNSFSIDRHPARPTLDLVTCWPLGSLQPGPLRLVVSAEAIDSSGHLGL